jgi:hypothetical protein
MLSFPPRTIWWRKIQKTGLSTEYKDNESNTGKWLNSFFGLAFLDPSDVEDCFGDDIMRVLPEDPRCTSFADYILEITLCRIQGFLHIVVFITVTQRKTHN